MKKSDWALVILIVAVVGVISYFVIGSVLPPPEDEEVKTAPSITAAIDVPENNVILYDDSRPSWCTLNSNTGSTGSEDEAGDGANDSDEENDTTAENTEGKQYINSAFNACEINSSFTTTTE